MVRHGPVVIAADASAAVVLMPAIQLTFAPRTATGSTPTTGAISVASGSPERFLPLESLPRRKL